MKRHLVVLWGHIPGNIRTIIRASDTGKTLQVLIEEIRPLLLHEGTTVSVVYEELARGEDRDRVLMNGIPLESLVAQAASGQARCRQSGCMPATVIYPRYIPTPGGLVMEAPEILFRKAVLLALEEP
jgi:hypothetical protein